MFQQRLSSQKTPTLCWDLPAFAAMIQLYNEKLDEHPHLANAIRAGSKKLDEYAEKIREAPAYILAMGIVSPRQTAIHTDDLHDVYVCGDTKSERFLVEDSRERNGVVDVSGIDSARQDIVCGYEG